MVCGPASSSLPGNLVEMQISDSNSDLPNQNLHLIRALRSHMFIKVWEALSWFLNPHPSATWWCLYKMQISKNLLRLSECPGISRVDVWTKHFPVIFQVTRGQTYAVCPPYLQIPPTADHKYLGIKFQKVLKSKTWIRHVLATIYIAFMLY